MKKSKILLFSFLVFFFTNESNAQTSCASPLALTPGTAQCGTNNNVGSFPDAGGAPANPCNSLYNDGEYWFSFVGTGQALQLDVSGLSATYSGIYVLNNCPASTPTCVASYTNGSSTANYSVTTPALTNGTTYYIVIANWSAPYSTNFCLNSTLVAAPVPPANDECSGAYPLTVNGNFSCGSVTAGTVINATASPQSAASCGGTEDDDVWFSFTATNSTHTISLLNITGSTSDLYHSVWTGTCPSLSLFGATCSDPNSSTVTGLTPGTTYYLRVYTWTATAGQTSSFNVCIGTPPPPPANDECSGAISLTVNPNFSCASVTPGTIASATASSQSAAACGGTEDDDVWFSFVATGPTHTIDLLSITGSTTDLYHSVWTGACPGLSLVAGTCSDPNSSTVTGLTAGVTYYVRVYSWTATAGQTSSFNICIGTPPPPPTNDECSGALPLTVNPNQLCASTTPGTIASATASTQNTASCNGTEDDDVWFSFVATSSQHYIDLLNVSGSTTDLYHSVWEGTCPALTLVTGTCSDPNSSTVTGLTPGNTYYIRVYSWTSTTGQTSTFDVCVGSDAVPTCSDGIQNQGEAGIDCGGPCPACPPPSCTDGIQNQGETGIDCGGPCASCPPVLIPTACSNVTYSLTVNGSVSFYDDGGPGADPCGDITGTGNYCNCNCFTTVTICGGSGQYVVADFREFAMWNTTSGWDWMRIYDNNAASGTILYDNSSTGPNNPFGDCGIGSTVMNYCSSGNCLTFQFWATSVVNRAGWDALVTSVAVACIIPLPVELIELGAKNNSNHISLNWKTASEVNSSHFIIERSSDGQDWETVGRVNAAGNSNQNLDYQFNDFNPLSNLSFYRLKIYDLNGESDISNIVSVNRNFTSDLDILVAPNPASTSLEISLNNYSSDYVKMSFYDISGKMLLQKEFFQFSEKYQITDLTKLSKGTVILMATDINQKTIGRKLIVIE